MAINVQVHGKVGRMEISGRFDFQMHREFKDAYTRLTGNAALSEIEIEMGKVDYLDSSALGMLMLLKQQSEAAKKTVALLNPSAMVKQVLEVANFNKIFNIRSAI